MIHIIKWIIFIIFLIILEYNTEISLQNQKSLTLNQEIIVNNQKRLGKQIVKLSQMIVAIAEYYACEREEAGQSSEEGYKEFYNLINDWKKVISRDERDI